MKKRVIQNRVSRQETSDKEAGESEFEYGEKYNEKNGFRGNCIEDDRRRKERKSTRRIEEGRQPESAVNGIPSIYSCLLYTMIFFFFFCFSCFPFP